MTALLLDRVQDVPHRALDLPVHVSDQMGDGAGLRLLGEQLARGGEPLGGPLAYLRAETLDDAFLPRRKSRQPLLSWCHADPFPNAPGCSLPETQATYCARGGGGAWDAHSILQVVNLLRRETPGRPAAIQPGPPSGMPLGHDRPEGRWPLPVLGDVQTR
jgi:hypothetical protein